jgi:type I restriction enzyme S subunit
MDSGEWIVKTARHSQLSTLNSPFKQTEVGVIPEDWEVKHLGSVAAYTNGKAHEGYISDFGKYIVVNSKFVSTNGEVKKYSDRRFSPASKGEILMVMSDVPNGRAIARCFFVDRDDVYTVNQRICALQPLRIDGRFLFYKLNRNPFYLSFDDGVKQTNLRKDDVLACPLALPPTKAEQEAIAEALSDADALIESLEQLIAKKRQIKQGAMQELLTGKKRLPGFGGEWVVKLLADIAPLQRGFDLPNSKLQQGPYPVVYSNGVLNHHVAFQVKGPGVVTGRSGTIGTVTFVEKDFWPHNTSLWVTTFKGNDPKFVFYLYTRIGLERFATGSGVPTLNRNDVHAFKVGIPLSTAEQTAITAILTDMDAEIAALEEKLAKAYQIKQGMMHNLLTGKIRLVGATGRSPLRTHPKSR